MPPSVLIADDSATNRALYDAMFTRAGHRVDTAANGEEALRLFVEHHYDIVFLDINMPRMDGIAAARAIQSRNTRNIPVYAISGIQDTQKEKDFLSAGIRRLIVKPLDRAKINDALRESGITAGATSVPLPALQKLAVIYARELRARAQSCRDCLHRRDTAKLSREIHTLRALAQMLGDNVLLAATDNNDYATQAARIDAIATACEDTAGKIETSTLP